MAPQGREEREVMGVTGETVAHGTSPRARRIAEIRAWRDRTEGLYGLPHYPSDPPMVTNNKGWWRDVCDLLDVMDGKPAREGSDA